MPLVYCYTRLSFDMMINTECQRRIARSSSCPHPPPQPASSVDPGDWRAIGKQPQQANLTN